MMEEEYGREDREHRGPIKEERCEKQGREHENSMKEEGWERVTGSIRVP